MHETLQLNFYKGINSKHGAVQFRFQKPHYFVKSNPKLKNYDGKFIYDSWLNDNQSLTSSDLASREGALFLEITSATGKNVYDWDNKIFMALSITDIGKLLMVLDGEQDAVNIMHDPGAKSETAGQVKKYLSVSSPQGIQTGVMVTVALSDSTTDKKVKHTVPLSGDEAKVLNVCLKAILPKCLAWV